MSVSLYLLSSSHKSRLRVADGPKLIDAVAFHDPVTQHPLLSLPLSLRRSLMTRGGHWRGVGRSSGSRPSGMRDKEGTIGSANYFSWKKR